MTETIGLDIGSHSIKLTGLRMTSKGPFLTHLGIKEIPYGSEREDPTLLSETIKSLYREADLKPGKVKLTVSGTGIHIQRISLPSMPKGELRNAVRWEMKAHVPFSVDSAKIDFLVLGESVEKDQKKIDVITVACSTHLIERSLAIADSVGLKPIHLGVSPFALWNLLLTFDHIGKEGGVGLIDLGAEKTGIHLFQDGVLQFSRECTPGGMDLTRAIMEGMESDEEHSLLYDRAEKIKHDMGIPSKSFYEKNGDQSTHRSKIPYLVRPFLESLISEIGRSLDDYRNQSHLGRVDRLFLSGGSANIKNVATYLSESLRLPVERLSPFDKILFDTKNIDPLVLDRKGPAFAVALGTALPDRRQIDLLPAKKPYGSTARTEKWIPRLSALITFLVFIWIIWSMSTQVATLKNERDERMAKAETIEMLQARLTLLKEKENKMKADLSLFPSSAVVPVPFQKALTRVRRIVPDNVTVTLLSIQSGKARSDKQPPREESLANGKYELQIKGIVFGSDFQCLTSLARVIEGLEKSSFFKNAKLISAVENKSYNRPGVSFEMVCDMENENSPPSLSSRTDSSTGGQQTSGGKKK